uniref:Uncharacterized protein n=1 Tax=Amphimedon queenslandica TaxID=400682 RepID=A0A1X7VJC0_AMPQE
MARMMPPSSTRCNACDRSEVIDFELENSSATEDFEKSVGQGGIKDSEQADNGGCTPDDSVFRVAMEESATVCSSGQHQVDEKTDKEAMTDILMHYIEALEQDCSKVMASTEERKHCGQNFH